MTHSIMPDDDGQTESCNSPQTFKLVVHLNHAEIIADDGKPLSHLDYDLIADLIRHGKQLAKQRYYLHNLVSWCQNCEWIFPTKPKDVYGSGQCVYFVLSTSMPHLVKIGRTTNLSSRHKQIGWTTGSQTRVLAYAKTRNANEMEEALHLAFRYYRVTGEWFSLDAVQRLLRVYGGAR